MAKAVLDEISEEYYQINEGILSSFPKYRPPLDLFYFDEKVCQLIPFSKKGVRLTNEQVENLAEKCEAGNVFVARSDHAIYSKHIIKQLDLVLMDRNLKSREIASICIEAMILRLNDFFQQPVKPQFEKLESDLKVITQYLWEDKHRIGLFLKRLWGGEHSLANHSLNTMILGLWFLLKRGEDKINRKLFDEAALAFLIHDVGMTKIPPFILNKTKPLTLDEKDSIPPHVLTSVDVAHKMGLVSDTADRVILEHHERLDGSGYPQKISDLSTLGRISAVADAFSAMIQIRPYADALKLEEAARKLGTSNTKFDIAFSGAILAGVIEGKISIRN